MSGIIPVVTANPEKNKIQSIQPFPEGHFLYITTKLGMLDIKCYKKGIKYSGGSKGRISMVLEKKETKRDIRKYFLKVVLESKPQG